MSTIKAQLVAVGVGLPTFWLDTRGYLFDSRDVIDQLHAYSVDLSDPQTAFGLALKLDEWERTKDMNWDITEPGYGPTWVRQLVEEGNAIALARMAARIETIGLDHRIRRALGWEVELGTLAALTFDHRWVFSDGRGRIEWGPDGAVLGSAKVSGWYECVPALAGITDPLEALRAIAAEVAP